MPPEGRSRGVDDARSPDIVEIVGGDTVAESAVDEIKAAVVESDVITLSLEGNAVERGGKHNRDEFRPADASSVAWCLSWPDSRVVTDGDSTAPQVVESEVVAMGRAQDAEHTIVGESDKVEDDTVDEDSPAAKQGRRGSKLTCTSGSRPALSSGPGPASLWMDRFRH